MGFDKQAPVFLDCALCHRYKVKIPIDGKLSSTVFLKWLQKSLELCIRYISKRRHYRKWTHTEVRVARESKSLKIILSFHGIKMVIGMFLDAINENLNFSTRLCGEVLHEGLLTSIRFATLVKTWCKRHVKTRYLTTNAMGGGKGWGYTMVSRISSVVDAKGLLMSASDACQTLRAVHIDNRP